MTHAYQETNLSALERPVSIQSWLLVWHQSCSLQNHIIQQSVLASLCFFATGKSEILTSLPQGSHAPTSQQTESPRSCWWPTHLKQKYPPHAKKEKVPRFLGAKARYNMLVQLASLQILYVSISKKNGNHSSYLWNFRLKKQKWSWIAGHTSHVACRNASLKQKVHSSFLGLSRGHLQLD